MTTATLERPAAPERSLQQRRDAIRRANVIRVYRARMKRDIKAGRISVRQLIADPPAEIETMKVFNLLLAVPKVGRVRVDGMLKRCTVSPSKTLGGLSERQRRELARLLSR